MSGKYKEETVLRTAKTVVLMSYKRRDRNGGTCSAKTVVLMSYKRRDRNVRAPLWSGLVYLSRGYVHDPL